MFWRKTVRKFFKLPRSRKICHPPCLQPEGAGSRWCHTIRSKTFNQNLCLSCLIAFEIKKLHKYCWDFFLVIRKWQWYTLAKIVASGGKWVNEISNNLNMKYLFNYEFIRIKWYMMIMFCTSFCSWPFTSSPDPVCSVEYVFNVSWK